MARITIRLGRAGEAGKANRIWQNTLRSHKKARHYSLWAQERAARDVVRVAQENLADDFSRRGSSSFSGTLYNSIRVGSVTRSLQARRNRAMVVVNAPHAAAQELGFKGHALGSRASTRVGGLFNVWLEKKGLPGAGIWVEKVPIYTFGQGGYFLQPAINRVTGAKGEKLGRVMGRGHANAAKASGFN